MSACKSLVTREQVTFSPAALRAGIKGNTKVTLRQLCTHKGHGSTWFFLSAPSTSLMSGAGKTRPAPKPKIMEWVGRELGDQLPTPLPWTGTTSRLFQALSNLKCLPLPPALGADVSGDVSRAGGKLEMGKSPAGTAASTARLHHKSAQREPTPSIPLLRI